MFKKLPRSFYLRPTLTVAKDLLGKYFCRRIDRQLLIGKIVEVEAYLGETDPASHAYRGQTIRNEVMFWEGGHLYVYFTYGMHFCANVVTEEKGKGRAILLRAVEPIKGIKLMCRNRGFTTDGTPARRSPPLRTAGGDYRMLANGPAKLCDAFGIKKAQNGTDLLGDEIYIANGETIPESKIISTIRIGVKNGSDKKWRFYIEGNRWVST
ncbi:MAG: DNA-3-methyladenine glycosylase [Ignavibacteriae bacterium]|nr:DNA-3-methyladenine glycosylase [Ignavibacteriota bacterium]